MNFSLPIELIEQLQALSDQTMAPQSRIVERAIKEYIERQEGQKQEKPPA